MSDFEEGEEQFVAIGERLKRAREARAMTLDEVASQTRIPMRHLQHIELGEWDALPAPTYAIGFTRNYATAIGLDGPAIANELRDEIGGPRRRTQAPEYYEPADPARVPPKSLVIGVIVAIILLVGAYSLWRYLSNVDGGPAETQVTDEAIANDAAPAGNDQAAAPQDVTGQAVTLTALADVWLRVTDGQGSTPLFMGVLTTGQTYTVPATATRPLLRTANPQLLRASAAGRDLGLIGPTRRTVNDVSLLAADLSALAAGQTAAPVTTPATAAAPAPAPSRRAPAARTPAPAPAPVQTQPPAQQPATQLSVPPPAPQQ